MKILVQKYYVDTSVWLNLFKKEGDETKGIPFWKSAEDFIAYVEQHEGTIFVSTIVLKESYFKLQEKFQVAKDFFKNHKNIKIIKTTNDDYELARRLEQTHSFKLSFYDFLHIAIAKRLSVPLITRDGDLIEVAKELISVKKPENLIR